MAARAAWQSTREQHVDPEHETGELRGPVAPWSGKTSEVQLAEPVDRSHQPVMGWTCTNGDVAPALYSGKTRWRRGQLSSGAPFTHAAIRTLLR